MADESPGTKIATACNKANHAKGLLVAASLGHWCTALESAGLLSATGFSAADGATEAASRTVFEVDLGKEDDARDKAMDLCVRVADAADSCGSGRKIPADKTPELMAEFREVARTLAGHEAAVRSITTLIAQKSGEALGLGHIGSPAPAGVPASAGALSSPAPAPKPLDEWARAVDIGKSASSSSPGGAPITSCA